MSEPLLAVSDVTRHFGGYAAWLRLLGGAVGSERKEVLRGVTFQVEEGERASIVGTNGIGKTTLLEILVGLLRPSSGAVRIGGQDALTWSRRPRGVVSYVPADERTFPWRLTPRQNLEFFAGLSGLRGLDATSRVAQLLERFNLAAYADQPFGQLSSGTRQRMSIARALLIPPRLLLLDEPTRSLDSQQAASIWEAIANEMGVDGGSIVFVTHELDDAANRADRILILLDGVIKRDLRPAELRSQEMDGEGLTIAVQGLTAAALESLRAVVGVREVRSGPGPGGDQILEVWGAPGKLAIEGCVLALTDHGASIASLRRGAPLQALLASLGDSPSPAAVPDRIPA